MIGILGWIVFGFFAGLVARALFPGRQKLGFIATTLLGMGGAFVGGWIGNLLFHASIREVEPSGFIGAVIGAMIILFLAGSLARRSR